MKRKGVKLQAFKKFQALKYREPHTSSGKNLVDLILQEREENFDKNPRSINPLASLERDIDIGDTTQEAVKENDHRRQKYVYQME